MAKQDETAPDSQDQDVVNTLIPFDDFLEKIIQVTAGEGQRAELRSDWRRFFDTAVDNYNTYIEGKDLEPLSEDYIKSIFNINSQASSLDLKFRTDLLEKIKNSRTT